VFNPAAMKMQRAGIGARADDFAVLNQNRSGRPPRARGILIGLFLCRAHEGVVGRNKTE